jgi:rhodanese-related sulfurtransferase
MRVGRKSYKEMVDEAKTLHGDPNVVFVDLRDPRELKREGVIPGAFHAPRGMLEF